MSIVALPVTPQCATPTITIVGGKLHFACETEGVQFHYKLVFPGSRSGTGNDISVQTTCVVQVYASRDGYDNSEMASFPIKASIKGDVNADGVLSAQDASLILQRIAGKISDEEWEK